ncbi:MAG: LytTR family transcriptional regulator DNA-binding domain-containing protein [Verrucomicrobium sp.]|nr:LytTR family transcriptional regulator DNA-binding domain-containing protein [Verrucomicrobium sp.]
MILEKSSLSADPDAEKDETSFWQSMAYLAATDQASMAAPKALALLGRRIHADRAWIIRYNKDRTHFWITHEWIASGIVSHMRNVQEVPIDMLDGVLELLDSGKVLCIPDVNTMNIGSDLMKEELLRQSIKSIIMAPLCLRRRSVGMCGFDKVRHHTHWTDADAAFLKRAARFLVDLLGADVEDPTPEEVPPLQSPARLVTLLQNRTLMNVDVDQILYIETFGDYTWVNLVNGRRYMERRSLRSWEALLPPEEFIRIHQRYLVRGDHVQGLRRDSAQGWQLGLKGCKDLLPVGRTYRHLLRQRMAF